MICGITDRLPHPSVVRSTPPSAATTTASSRTGTSRFIGRARYPLLPCRDYSDLKRKSSATSEGLGAFCSTSGGKKRPTATRKPLGVARDEMLDGRTMEQMPFDPDTMVLDPPHYKKG